MYILAKTHTSVAPGSTCVGLVVASRARHGYWRALGAVGTQRAVVAKRLAAGRGECRRQLAVVTGRAQQRGSHQTRRLTEVAGVTLRAVVLHRQARAVTVRANGTVRACSDTINIYRNE